MPPRPPFLSDCDQSVILIIHSHSLIETTSSMLAFPELLLVSSCFLAMCSTEAICHAHYCVKKTSGNEQRTVTVRQHEGNRTVPQKFKHPSLLRQQTLRGGMNKESAWNRKNRNLTQDKKNRISVGSETNSSTSSSFFHHERKKIETQSSSYSIWQALFFPEIISQATLESEKRDVSTAKTAPPPDAMDIFLLPLAFSPGLFFQF